MFGTKTNRQDTLNSLGPVFQNDELMINPMYQQPNSLRSTRQISAKKSLPFNVENIQKH